MSSASYGRSPRPVFRDPKRVRCDELAERLRAGGFRVEAMMTGLVVGSGYREMVVVCLPWGPDERLWFLAEPDRALLADADKLPDAVAAIRGLLAPEAGGAGQENVVDAVDLRERHLAAFWRHAEVVRIMVNHHADDLDPVEITVLLEYLTGVIDSVWGVLTRLEGSLGDRASSFGRDGQAVIDDALVDLSLGHHGLRVASHLIAGARVGLMSLDGRGVSGGTVIDPPDPADTRRP